MRETTITCDKCKKTISVTSSGGKRPDFVVDVYWHQPEIYVIKNNRDEEFDFCSRDCVELGDF